MGEVCETYFFFFLPPQALCTAQEIEVISVPSIRKFDYQRGICVGILGYLRITCTPRTCSICTDVCTLLMTEVRHKITA